jgi:hypothetical protein
MGHKDSLLQELSKEWYLSSQLLFVSAVPGEIEGEEGVKMLW